MKQFSISAAALVLGLAVAGSVQAGGKSSHPSGGPRSSGSFHSSGSFRPSNYHVTYGKSFNHGYFYPGKYHNWSYHFWDRRYGCNLYYDSALCCYYYYCVPDQCYYPVSYCPYRIYNWQVPTALPATATATAVATASAGSGATPLQPPPPPPAPLAVGAN
jgi:hypothetical protein